MNALEVYGVPGVSQSHVQVKHGWVFLEDVIPLFLSICGVLCDVTHPETLEEARALIDFGNEISIMVGRRVNGKFFMTSFCPLEEMAYSSVSLDFAAAEIVCLAVHLPCSLMYGAYSQLLPLNLL